MAAVSVQVRTKSVCVIPERQQSAHSSLTTNYSLWLNDNFPTLLSVPDRLSMHIPGQSFPHVCGRIISDCAVARLGSCATHRSHLHLVRPVRRPSSTSRPFDTRRSLVLRTSRRLRCWMGGRRDPRSRTVRMP